MYAGVGMLKMITGGGKNNLLGEVAGSQVGGISEVKIAKAQQPHKTAYSLIPSRS